MTPTPDPAPSKVINLEDHREAMGRPPRLSILFVEDDDVDARLIEMAMAKSAFFDIRVARATSIETARQLLSDRDFDLLLLDYWLGSETGLPLLEDLGGRNSRIPVVLLTGYSSQDVQHLGHLAGALSFLSKDDVSSNTLDSVIRSALYTHELGRELLATLLKRDRILHAKLAQFGKITQQIEGPLNTIAEYATRTAFHARNGHLDEKFVDRLETIEDCAQQIRSLAGELTRQAQSDQYQGDLVFAPVDLGGLVGKALRLIGVQFADRAQRIDYALPETPVVARVDETAMLQAVLNVLSNAGKFSPVGSTVKVKVRDEDGEAVISVLDQGIGMSKSDMKVALQPFGRVKQTKDMPQEGAGLGLPIVSSVVSLHGGRMEIDSNPGQGTEFRIVLVSTS